MSGVQILRVGSVGLSLREELLLMAMIRLVGKGQPQIRWEYVSDLSCDVLINGSKQVDTAAGYRSHAVQIAAVRPGEGERSGLVLHFPLRAAAVISVLNQIGDRWASASLISPIQRELKSLGPVQRTTPGPAQLVAEKLHRELQQPGDVIELGMPTQPPLLVIECWRKQFFLPAEPTPVVNTNGWTTLFAQIIQHCEVRRAFGARTAYMSAQAPRRPLDRMLWRLGMNCTESELLSWMPGNGRYQLRRWPDFGALGTQPKFIKLAALLVRQPMTVDELTRNGHMQRTEVCAFLNGCELCGLLRIVTTSTEIVAVPRASLPAPQPAAGMRGLLGRIRSALHLS